MGTREGTTTRSGNIKSAGGGGGADLANRTKFEGHANLTDRQVGAVEAYQAGANYDINQFLRGRNPIELTGQHKVIIKELDASIANSRVNQPILVRRAIKMPAGNAILKAGMTFHDAAFWSTSTKGQVHKGFQAGRASVEKHGVQNYVFRVRVPAGARGLYVQGVKGVAHGDFGHEHELMLPRGSKVKIRRARTVKGGFSKGTIVLDADLIT
jgi:hypothetical protein